MRRQYIVEPYSHIARGRRVDWGPKQCIPDWATVDVLCCALVIAFFAILMI